MGRRQSCAAGTMMAVTLLAACAGGEGPASIPGDAGIVQDARVIEAAPAPITGDASPPDSGGVRCSGKTGTTGDSEHKLTVGGRERSFLLHVPPSYRPEQGVALVLAFHGFTENPVKMREASHYDAVADDRGFVVAYPAGLGGSFNAGACCGTSAVGNVDDVGFTRAVLDAIEASLCIDPQRVFASGFSNGGFLAHRLACELSDRIAAIGVESGQDGLASCAPGRAVPVAQVHGTSDPVVPFGGNPALGFRPTMETMQRWADRNGCRATRTVTAVVGDTTCEAWDGCRDGATVTLCRVQGGGHDWFGGGSLWTDAGPPPGFNTTLFFADFFAAHPMPR